MLRKIITQLKNGVIKPYQLEKFLPTNESVEIRRDLFGIKKIPHKNYDYSQVYQRNCENVIGYTRVPIGLIGPININNTKHMIPFATTEGALVSSLNRGAKMISNIKSICIDQGITRAPIIEVPNLDDVKQIIHLIDRQTEKIQEIFSSTTKYGKLIEISSHPIGKIIHLRFRATTGEAMGMNIISKGVDEVLKYIKSFYSIKILSLSGNLCTDKKPSAINWITGRGKKVIAEAFVSNKVLASFGNVSARNLVQLNMEKNLIGSALAGSIGGNNAHLANIIAGIYLATGQDLGQIGTSSVGLTRYIEGSYDGEDGLEISLAMPSLEIGMIGGGTELFDQRACLEIMKVNNVNQLAEVIGGICLAGELSLMYSLCQGDLMKAHLRLNRKNQ